MTKPPTIKAAGSTKVVVREKADDGDDSGSGRFPIASASDSAKNRKLAKAVFGELSTFSLAC